jgi:hypothetical protein
LPKIVVCLGLAGAALTLAQTAPPKVAFDHGASRLVVQGKPFLIRGAELGNSSAGTAAEADTVLPKMAALHINTVLMPVAWEQIEPAEGQLDFSILDHWVSVARQNDLHLVLLWFGSWKNAFSEYAPVWVKSSTKRFPREISADGEPTEILSPLGDETRKCDARAFAALMRHVREIDETKQTILMVQVENEIGFLGRGGRDRSEMANRLFDDYVPAELKSSLSVKNLWLLLEDAQSHVNHSGRTWREVFGDGADEFFMAWHYARFVEAVAAAGKKEYALPMYMNAQLPAPFERAGSHPSGGPYPKTQLAYRAAAPSIDFYSPDIYWPNFEEWIERYSQLDNPVFVPEARLAGSAYNAFYVYGQARGFGFSPFGVDSAGDDAKPIADTYALIDELTGEILDAQSKDRVRALVLHANSPRPTQTVALGGYLFEATLARTWPARTLATDDGALMAIETAPGDFLIAGSGLTVAITRDPDAGHSIAGIASVEQVTKTNGQWTVERRLNGDQTNQGRNLQMDAHAMGVYRVKLYNDSW